MVYFPTQIPKSDSHSPALLDLFISSDTSICCTVAFRPLRTFYHVIITYSTDFPTNSKWDALFYHLAYDYFCAD